MKTIYYFLLFSLIVIASCDTNKEPTDLDLPPVEYDYTGIIHGPDPGMCPCCGGWIISIENDQTPYRFSELPDEANFSLDTTEIPVQFNWTLDYDCNGIQYIIINEIALN